MVLKVVTCSILLTHWADTLCPPFRWHLAFCFSVIRKLITKWPWYLVVRKNVIRHCVENAPELGCLWHNDSFYSGSHITLNKEFPFATKVCINVCGVFQNLRLGSHPALQYFPRNRHTVFALLRFVVVIHWLIFPYPSGLLHWHCGNLTIAPVPAKQPWWIWINISCEFIMNDCITTTKQSTAKPCAYFLGYTVYPDLMVQWSTICLSSSYAQRVAMPLTIGIAVNS